MITEVIFDIETKKLFEEIDTHNPADLGISLVSLYKRNLDENYHEISGQMYSFFENDFSSMWTHFANVDRIIGFNSLKFDNPALAPLCPFSFNKLSHFDILEKIKDALGFRLSLNAIAKETLGTTKTDVGTNAVLYYKQGTKESLDKLKNYCESDVLVTRDVYDYGLQHKHLKYKDKWNTARIIDVNFSYPKSDNKEQISLF